MDVGAHVAGLLLAAGGGRRMGMPKALVRTVTGEPWVVRGARVLLDAGCSPVVVVVGARATEVEQLIAAAFGDEPRLRVQRANLWSEGMSASLRAGLGALSPHDTDGVLVTLVDTPSLRVETVARVRSNALAPEGRPRHALVQAVFNGSPGHPVFIGSAHWSELSAQLAGDSGAKAYLRAHGATEVECSDLESGEDIDSPDGSGADGPPTQLPQPGGQGEPSSSSNPL